ncbi:hypothetical protein [Paenibacillus protaetiae]|uniref:Uncharacterized protein n=1 Tax=Paenibacillus protaetiae TaxID=2509456 RepID=A0A4P6ERH1_9BACL|nr:hypothetical protein [Paenibacillus protaetiae]QAY65464.1 hypothetical protein ET464_02810 [Paenibacillus protaetiae]
MAKGNSKAKVVKKTKSTERKQYHYKLVLSDTCAVCKTPCERGMSYLARMKKPGAVGKGVPCILTRTYS